ILIRLFAMKDREIIELAIEGVAELGDLVVDLLFEGLKSTSSRIRENSASTLGRIASRAAVKPLIERLDDGNWWVRRAAVQALGEIRDTQAIEPLLRCLADNMETVQAQAIRSLVGFGKSSTEPLLNALRHEKNKFVIRAIILTLGDIKDTASIPSLIEHLSSSYFVIRLAAARALVQFGPEVIDAVVPRLAVKRMNIQPLLKAATGDSLLNQIRAIRALGALEDHRAVGVLKKLTGSAHPRIAEAADESLSSVGRAAWARCGCLLVLREMNDPSALPHYMQALTDTSANVRLEAVRGLGKNASEQAVAPLIEAAKNDRDPYVRAEAVRFLREIGVGRPSALEYALAALSDPDRDVRSQAAMLLGNFRDDRSISPLIRAMTDRHWIVRESAEISLHNFGERSVPPLLDALSSKVWTLRFRAARLLGEIGDSRAVKPLEALLKKKKERRDVRAQVKTALEKLRKRPEAGG
ncbi:HEAT repeat domain-containing protein, partial [bacterium]|nr:HEAT repeat domain-containing protein [bacterium]